MTCQPIATAWRAWSSFNLSSIPTINEVGLEELSFMATQEPDITDVRRECLNHCLRKLPVENRELIIEYYRKEGQQKIDHRVAMAERLGILRTRYGVAPNASGTN